MYFIIKILKLLKEICHAQQKHNSKLRVFKKDRKPQLRPLNAI